MRGPARWSRGPGGPGSACRVVNVLLFVCLCVAAAAAAAGWSLLSGRAALPVFGHEAPRCCLFVFTVLWISCCFAGSPPGRCAQISSAHV